MSFFKSPPKATEPEAVAHLIRLTGTGASAPTVTMGGKHVSIARSGAGVYTLTWRDKPGVFVAATAGIQAVTPGDIKNHSVVLDTYDSSAKTMDVTFWDAAAAAHDLAANEFINIVVWFKDTGV